ncbi:MAG: hypothetical protein JEZ08_25280 [Clostridiales bacterium]|nr:hypothetical protein [Clostridiales bacterium]
MKQLFVWVLIAIVLSACNQNDSLIKEHIKKDYFDEPSATFDFEKLQMDSIYTVSDSISVLLKQYNRFSGFVSHIADKGYVQDSMELSTYVDSTCSVIHAIRLVYRESAANLTNEIKELEDLLKDSKAAGMGSFMSALGSLAGTQFEDELRKKKKELKGDYETLEALEQIESILGQVNKLMAQDPEKELCRFWYVQFIVKAGRGSMTFDKRLAYKYVLAPLNDEFVIIGREKLN